MLIFSSKRKFLFPLERKNRYFIIFPNISFKHKSHKPKSKKNKKQVFLRYTKTNNQKEVF